MLWMVQGSRERFKLLKASNYNYESGGDMSRILISAVLWVLLNQSPFVLAEETRPIRFEWAFGAKVGDNDRLVSIERDTTLSTGDRIQFYVKADTATVVYLIYVDSNGNLLTLSGLDTPSSSYIPDRERWFTLDETTGTESFYLASSHGRHKALEKLLIAYATAEEEDRPELKDQVIALVRSLRRTHRRLATRAERSISIAGTFVGRTMTSLGSPALSQAKRSWRERLRSITNSHVSCREGTDSAPSHLCGSLPSCSSRPGRTSRCFDCLERPCFRSVLSTALGPDLHSPNLPSVAFPR